MTVVGNRIARTRAGIYLEHETNDSLFACNVISDTATGITVEWRYDDVGSSGNTFEANTVVRPTEAGVFVDVEGDRNRIVRNVVAGGSGPAVVLQGASGNLVAGNRACASGPASVWWSSRALGTTTGGRHTRCATASATTRARRRARAGDRRAREHRRELATGAARRSPATPATSSRS